MMNKNLEKISINVKVSPSKKEAICIKACGKTMIKDIKSNRPKDLVSHFMLRI